MKSLSINVLLLVLLLVSFCVSLSLGPMSLQWGQLLAATPNMHQLVFWELRIPRSVLAVLVGAALGMCGAMLQGWTRNPLADPGLFGTTACASLGGVLAIHSGAFALTALALPVAGLAGAGLGAIFMLLFVGRQLRLGSLILAGVAVQSFAGALIALTLNLAPDPHSALEIAFWLLGSVSEKSQQDIWLVLPFLLLGVWLAWRTRMTLDALTLGDETALGMGAGLQAMQRRVLLAATLLVGPAAAVAGAIGFIGLVVPHILRLSFGAHPSRLLMPSLLGGGVLLLWADMLVRLIPSGSELKLGVVTALLGCPIFFWLLLRLRHAGAMQWHQ